MDLLYRLEAQLTETVPIGVVPEGVRLDLYFDGRLTHGQLAGARVRGIDYLLLRADGVGVIDVRAAFVADGGHVEVKAQGYLVAPDDVELPPPDAILAPGYIWPDVELPIREFAVLRTGAAEWQDLNTTIAAIEGTVNPGTGQLALEARAFERAGTFVEAGGARRRDEAPAR
jgi:hypothetical protein